VSYTSGEIRALSLVERREIMSKFLERFAIACTVGADLRIRPGLSAQATTGADT